MKKLTTNEVKALCKKYNVKYVFDFMTTIRNKQYQIVHTIKDFKPQFCLAVDTLKIICTFSIEAIQGKTQKELIEMFNEFVTKTGTDKVANTFDREIEINELSKDDISGMTIAIYSVKSVLGKNVEAGSLKVSIKNDKLKFKYDATKSRYMVKTGGKAWGFGLDLKDTKNNLLKLPSTIELTDGIDILNSNEQEIRKFIDKYR